ncbi:MAG: DAK2 domain-containing protein, partial [Mameliella sp.]|nr:DAK2 domain-containing protein [Mameliella sp.]
LDAWMPAAEAAGVAAREGATLQDALIRARDAARHGADATAQMQSGKGRSQKLGQRSIGHVDPGAASAALLLAAWSDAL